MKGKMRKLLSLTMAVVLVVSLCATIVAPASAITAAQILVTPTPTTAGASAQYTITFDHVLAAPVGTVVSITFPSAVGVPASIAYSHVRQGASAVSAAAATTAEATYIATDPAPIVSGNTVRVALKTALVAADWCSITFSQLAGFTNPNLASAGGATGTYKVSVGTTVEGPTTAATGFAITRNVAFSPTSSTLGGSITVTGVGFKANSSIDITGGAVGSGSTDDNGAFSVTASAAVTATAVTATDGAGSATTTAGVVTLIPAATLSPTTGIVGSTISVTCTGLTALTAYGLGFANTQVAVTSVSTGTATAALGALAIGVVTSDATGKIVCTIAVPANQSSGNKTVALKLEGLGWANQAAFAATGNSATGTYAVASRTVSLSPSTGIAGTTITITGAGFSAYAAAVGSTTVSSGGVTLTGGLTFSTTSEGSFTNQVVIPVGTAAGTYTITCTDSGGNAAAAKFTIPTAAPAVLAIAPLTGMVGETIVATGSNFAALSTVTVTFTTPAPAVTSVMGTGPTDSAGGCSISFVIPQSAVGFATVTLTDANGTAKAKTLTVTAGTAVVTVSDGLSGIDGQYTKVWAFEAVSQSWKLYDTAAPAVSDLTWLTKGQGYWVQATQACTLTYGLNSYSLVEGWNNIGWLG